MSLQPRSLLSLSRSKFIAAFVLTMLLMLPLLIYSLLSRSASAQTPEMTSDVGQPQTAQSQKAGCCGEDKDADKPHLLAASYYSLKDNLSATLMLNNKGPKPIEVRPTLFSLGGERLDIQPVTVESNTFRNIDLREWVALGGASFEEGSLQVFHRGKDLVLGAQVYLVDVNRSLSFEEKLTEFANAKSSRLEGIWWLPSRNSEVRLVLSNTSDAPLSVAANIDRASPNGKEPTMFDLMPHETRVMDVEREFTSRSGAALQRVGGISLEHSGSTGALVARAMIQEPAVGYSSPVQFSDPQAAKSNELHGAGLRLGRVADQRLTPIVVARNIGNSETVLTGRMPYSTHDGSAGAVSLPEVRLSPGEITTVNLAQAIKASNLPQNGLSAGLEFEYSGEPGSVLMTAQTISRDRNHVFRVPMWDPKAQRSATGGYPWYIDGDSSTVVYIKNVTDRPQDYVLQLDFSGGVYGLGIQSIDAGQTVTIDLRDLRENQAPNWKGQTIPLEATRGQIQWSLRGSENDALIGRTEQVDVARGISSNYACINCCQTVFADGWITPDIGFAPIDNSAQFRGMEQDQTCYSQLFDPYEVGNASWSSYNSSISSVSGGWAIALSPGYAGILAQWYAPVPAETGNPQSCETMMALVASPSATMVAFDFTLTVDFNDADETIRPSGTGGVSTAAVIVQTTPAVSDKTVTLELGSEMTENGGHVDHTGTRPRGSLAASQGPTTGSGAFQTTYTASVFGGSIRVKARMENRLKELDFRVLVPGLQQLGEGDNYNLRQVDDYHPAYHYGTVTANTNLPLIANDYINRYYATEPATEEEKLVFNDQSLIYGGKFEIAGNWGDGAHAEHREGKNCDVRYTNVPADRHEVLERIFRDNGSPNFLKHVPPEQPHYHLRF